MTRRRHPARPPPACRAGESVLSAKPADTILLSYPCPLAGLGESVLSGPNPPTPSCQHPRPACRGWRDQSCQPNPPTPSCQHPSPLCRAGESVLSAEPPTPSYQTPARLPVVNQFFWRKKEPSEIPRPLPPRAAGEEVCEQWSRSFAHKTNQPARQAGRGLGKLVAPSFLAHKTHSPAGQAGRGLGKLVAPGFLRSQD